MRACWVILALFCLCGLSAPVFAQQEGVDVLKKVSDKPWQKKPEDKEKAAPKDQADAQKFKSMARDLLGKPHWSDRFLGLLQDNTPKIAIHPFKEEDLPISLAEAQTYVDGVSRALINQAKGRYAIVGRAELGAVIADINEIGSSTTSLNPLGDLLDRARSDLLAVGHLSMKGENLILSYKLVETQTGRIVSTTQKSFKRKKEDANQQGLGLSMDAAAQKAAKALMGDLSDVRAIMVQGLRYQTSGVHSEFGRYFMELLSDQLRKAATSGARNINDLDIADFIVEEEKFRGLKLDQKASVESNALSEDQGRYLIKGSYWVFDAYVDVRLVLIGGTGQSLSWRGKVNRSEIPPDLALIPEKSPIAQDDIRPLGPNNFYVSSNKGDNPAFKVGEEMVLALKADQDAYVACYYIQADGLIFQIFPNDNVSSNKLVGGFVQHIPSKGMAFSFEFTPPRGVEALKCFATDVDVRDRLIPALKKAAFQPLAIKNERELTKIYRSLNDVVISEASLIITVQ